MTSEFILGDSLGALASPDAHQELMDAEFDTHERLSSAAYAWSKSVILHRDPKWWPDSNTGHNILDKRVDEALVQWGKARRWSSATRKDVFGKSTRCISSGGGKGERFPLYLQKEDTVEMNFRCILRDKAFWGEDDDAFWSEMWETSKFAWGHTPFGGGPRICPGYRLAFVEVAYVMVIILRKFEQLESRNNRPWTEETRTPFQNLQGAEVALFFA
ncbi:cytochrome P450 [Truncatella angustata]|uniref:Cytochrome P450 n=1 Tax=Truncatella angustata TaxID=152316 RepID=A0A9P8RHQ3_9PEZI|nr:cytochrome P450 [Truncatella angustata]KAH6639988.1 cytochrome P450 [Truncatella angustata]